MPSINHFKDSWKLMILLISHLWVAFVELFFPIHVIPCHLHPFPIHALGGANEGLQIFIFFDTSIDIAWDASNAPRLYAQKGFHTWDVPFLNNLRWSHFTHFLSKLEQPPFGHSIIGSHEHHLRCLHSFEIGLSNKTPFTSWRTTIFDSFCHKVMLFFEMLGEQPFHNISNGTCFDFTHSFQPHPSPM